MTLEDSVLTEIKIRKEINSQEISKLWRNDALHIVNSIDQGTGMVVVGAIGGSGKSANLIPQIIAVCKEKGSSAVSLDMGYLSGSDENEQTIKFLETRIKRGGVRQGIVMLDEASEVPEPLRILVTTFLHKQGFKGIVPLIHRITSGEPHSSELIWIEAEEISGGKGTTYELKPHQLSPDLAQEYLAVRNVPQDRTSYIVNNFPLYQRLLNQLLGEPSIDKIRERWMYLAGDWKLGYGFTAEEAEETSSTSNADLRA